MGRIQVELTDQQVRIMKTEHLGVEGIVECFRNIAMNTEEHVLEGLRPKVLADAVQNERALPQNDAAILDYGIQHDLISYLEQPVAELEQPPTEEENG